MSTPPARESAGTPPAAPLSADAQLTDDAQLAAAIAASMEDAGLSVADAAAASVVLLDDDGDENASAPAGAPAVIDVDRDLSRQRSAADPALNRDRSLRAQQDSEFEESLALDRARAESAARARAEAGRRAAAREAKRARVPAEPAAGEKGVAELVIRFPDGKRVRRRFRESDTLAGVADFVEASAEGGEEAEYDFVTPFPRKVLRDRSVSLAEAGLVPKAVLVVHLR